MAKRAIIRLGDRTSHGGTVVSADPTFIVEGRPAARVGDMVSCRRCGRTYPIVTGAAEVWSGKFVARHDDVTSCGAKLIASQGVSTIDDESTDDPGSLSLAAVALAVGAVPGGADGPHEEQLAQDTVDEPHAVRFQAIDPETGEPAARCVYILTRESGAQHGGLTDAAGFTEVIETTHPEQIGVHFTFKSPKDDIERWELTA